MAAKKSLLAPMGEYAFGAEGKPEAKNDGGKANKIIVEFAEKIQEQNPDLPEAVCYNRAVTKAMQQYPDLFEL